jgi:hypothetical protein
MRRLYISFCILLLCFTAGTTITPSSPLSSTPAVTLRSPAPLRIVHERVARSTVPEAEQIIGRRAQSVIEALARKDMAHVATLVHPLLGVRFSPYAWVEDTDLVFQAEQLSQLPGQRTIYTWGIYDGIGTPIDVTFDAYFQRFVYSHDFVHAEQISYNQRIGQGNTHDNSRAFYPQAIIVEYHFSGFDPKYDGMDWQSLRLVFQSMEQDWYLVGVIHDQWTI